jgi:hypothetical protein
LAAVSHKAAAAAPAADGLERILTLYGCAPEKTIPEEAAPCAASAAS